MGMEDQINRSLAAKRAASAANTVRPTQEQFTRYDQQAHGILRGINASYCLARLNSTTLWEGAGNVQEIHQPGITTDGTIDERTFRYRYDAASGPQFIGSGLQLRREIIASYTGQRSYGHKPNSAAGIVHMSTTIEVLMDMSGKAILRAVDFDFVPQNSQDYYVDAIYACYRGEIDGKPRANYRDIPIEGKTLEEALTELTLIRIQEHRTPSDLEKRALIVAKEEVKREDDSDSYIRDLRTD